MDYFSDTKLLLLLAYLELCVNNKGNCQEIKQYNKLLPSLNITYQTNKLILTVLFKAVLLQWSCN